MATRKKKVGEDAADVLNTPSGGWPVISQGTHLTVKTFEDGRTELIWDHDQLLKEVQEAIASVETKKTKGKKK
jgi:hypothetical protein